MNTDRKRWGSASLARAMLYAFCAICLAGPILVSVSGCTTTQSAPDATTVIGTLQKEATLARRTSTAFLQQGKLTPAQFDRVTAALDKVHASLALAASVTAADPAAAQRYIADATAALQGVQAGDPATGTPPVK